MTVSMWLGLIFSSVAVAGSITYNYQGVDFDRCGHGGCPGNYTSDYDVASLTFGSPLAANLSSADVTSSLTSWAIGDHLGYSAFSSSTVGSPQVLLSTDASGAIVGYQIEAGTQMGVDVAMFNPQVIGGGSGLLFADAVDSALGFSASNHQTGHWTESLNGVPGGPPTAPTFLIVSTSLDAVTSTIGPVGSVEYYSFVWPGGILSSTASITGAVTGASYLFSEGTVGTCNTFATTLDGTNNFSGSITSFLNPGTYCIGLDANSIADPTFTISFNSPLPPIPEPATFALLSFGLVTIGILHRTKRNRDFSCRGTDGLNVAELEGRTTDQMSIGSTNGA